MTIDATVETVPTIGTVATVDAVAKLTAKPEPARMTPAEHEDLRNAILCRLLKGTVTMCEIVDVVPTRFLGGGYAAALSSLRDEGLVKVRYKGHLNHYSLTLRYYITKVLPLGCI